MGGMPGMPAPGPGGLNLGGMDFSALLNNPALMNMVGIHSDSLCNVVMKFCLNIVDSILFGKCQSVKFQLDKQRLSYFKITYS